MKQLILASQSPRRKQLLEKTGIPFVVEVSEYEEVMDQNLSPEELVLKLSKGKAKDVAKNHKDALILAADTFVILSGKYLGKPKSREEAEEMLRSLSGNPHQVITGYTLIDTTTQKHISKAAASTVHIKSLSEETIKAYLDKNTYTDKAGAYAIQEVGDSFIEKIEGDYDTVVGLPVKDVLEDLKQFGH